MPIMNIKGAAQLFFLTSLVVITSCAPSASPVSANDEQNLQTLNSIETFDELSLLDPTLLKNQIRELSSEDDDEFDAENAIELFSHKNKILVVGDSWAVFPCLYGSMGKMIREQNADLVSDSRCLRTSKLGVRASEWMGSKQDLRVIKFLKNTPRIKYMYLSLGGNDLMGTWTKDFTVAQEQKLFAEINKTVQEIIKKYLDVSPNLKIILSGYDIPHFRPNHTLGLYKTIFSRMGSPIDQKINKALVDFTKYAAQVGNGKNIFYINHIGLAQHYDGVPEDKFPARQTLNPDLISPFNNPAAVGGNINIHSSEDSMINWLYLISDAFHLNHRNYLNVMNHTYRNVLTNIITN